MTCRSIIVVRTRWGAEDVLREQGIGPLEPGKLADLIVIDRDFLTAPIDDLPATRVMLTLVGSKMVFKRDR